MVSPITPVTLTLLCILFIRLVTSSAVNKTFQIGVLLPLHGKKSVGPEAVRATELARAWANENPTLTHIRAGGHFFDVSVLDTGCDTGKGLYELVETVTRLSDSGHALDAFAGPSCDNVCETAGLLAKYWNIPMISFGCEESKLADREDYPTFLRTTSTFSSMAKFLEKILLHYEWRRIMLVAASEQVWLETEDDLEHELGHDKYDIHQWRIREEEWDNITTLLREKTSLTRVFILCMFPEDVLRFMDAAKKIDILDGKYVFFSFDFANMGKRTEHTLDGSHLTGLLDITMDVYPEREEFIEFVETITVNSSLDFEDALHCKHYEYGIHASLLYDAILMYALGVETVLSNSLDPDNGTNVVSHLYDFEFDGISGYVHIHPDGSRDSLFMLHNLQGGCYVPILRSETASSRHGDVESIVILNNTVIWPGGSRVVPSDHPNCGWDGELCNNTELGTIVATVVTLCLAIIAVIAGGLYWRALKKKRESSLTWIINVDDLKMKPTLTKSRNGLGSSRNISSTDRSTSRLSCATDMSSGQIFAEQFTFLGEDVAGKCLEVDHKHPVVVTPTMAREINSVMALANTNICKFYGVCLAPSHEMSVWEYCKKGSLQDVLNNDQKYLDDMPFKVSFITDITKGLRYLHRSSLGYHGRLKSSNVLVDNRWTCKLAHFCIDSLDSFRPKEEPNAISRIDLLPVAPEVLRDKTEAKGSKASDIYSYGIILLEIFTVTEIQELFSSSHALEQAAVVSKRKRNKHRVTPDGIYLNGMTDGLGLIHEIMDAKEIIKRLKQGGPFPFRPHIPDTVDNMIRNLIMECWRETPTERPPIDQAFPVIRHVSAKYTTKSKSLMEQMLDKVTREADMQAQELKEEKNKSDALLYQMLPPTVADCLKRQIEVKPETFQAATVYFSDIQGFTDMVSVATPLEVVDFLNDVYYRFDTIIEKYRVYKVETIGDAYMVCSGVPLRVTMHATEVAKMALHILMLSHGLQDLNRPTQRLCMRIGLHSGPVAAGVVGRTMPRYCLFGDTVNTASRMESTSLAGRIQISQQCKALLETDVGFRYEAREPVHVKGKGILQTYFLLEKVGFNPLESTSSDIGFGSVSSKLKTDLIQAGEGSDERVRESSHKLSPISVNNKNPTFQESPLSLSSSITIDGDVGLPVM